MILIQVLLGLRVLIDYSTTLRDHACRQLLQDSVELELISSSVSVEVAAFVVGALLVLLSGFFGGNVLEYFQARNLRSIYVHVIQFWLLDEVQILFLSHFLLKHFGLLLILLDTVGHTVHKDVSVDDLLLSKSVGHLSVTKATSSGRDGNCGL